MCGTVRRAERTDFSNVAFLSMVTERVARGAAFGVAARCFEMKPNFQTAAKTREMRGLQNRFHMPHGCVRRGTVF